MFRPSGTTKNRRPRRGAGSRGGERPVQMHGGDGRHQQHIYQSRRGTRAEQPRDALGPRASDCSNFTGSRPSLYSGEHDSSPCPRTSTRPLYITGRRALCAMRQSRLGKSSAILRGSPGEVWRTHLLLSASEAEHTAYRLTVFGFLIFPRICPNVPHPRQAGSAS